MRRRRLALVALLTVLLSGLTESAVGQSPPTGAAGSPLSDRPAPSGMRTVCVGRSKNSVRTVGCFDVYSLNIGGVVDPVKRVNLRQYVWKYTAGAQGGVRRVVKLTAEVNSDAATIYDWAPGATVHLREPGEIEAGVATDLLADSESGGRPQLKTVTDGWRYRGLAGRFDPRLSDHRFATSWTSPEGQTAPAGEAAQVAGTTIWGASTPAPDLLPARLRVEATYR